MPAQLFIWRLWISPSRFGSAVTLIHLSAWNVTPELNKGFHDQLVKDACDAVALETWHVSVYASRGAGFPEILEESKFGINWSPAGEKIRQHWCLMRGVLFLRHDCTRQRLSQMHLYILKDFTHKITKLICIILVCGSANLLESSRCLTGKLLGPLIIQRGKNNNQFCKLFQCKRRETFVSCAVIVRTQCKNVKEYIKIMLQKLGVWYLQMGKTSDFSCLLLCFVPSCGV